MTGTDGISYLTKIPLITDPNAAIIDEIMNIIAGDPYAPIIGPIIRDMNSWPK